MIPAYSAHLPFQNFIQPLQLRDLTHFWLGEWSEDNHLRTSFFVVVDWSAEKRVPKRLLLEQCSQIDKVLLLKALLLTLLVNVNAESSDILIRVQDCCVSVILIRIFLVCPWATPYNTLDSLCLRNAIGIHRPRIPSAPSTAQRITGASLAFHPSDIHRPHPIDSGTLVWRSSWASRAAKISPSAVHIYVHIV